MDTNYKLSLGRLARKVDWEGGVLEAIQYGIKADEISDPIVAEDWRQLEQMWSSMEPALVAMNRRLRQEAERPAA